MKKILLCTDGSAYSQASYEAVLQKEEIKVKSQD